jgi:hypothetical protein
MARKKTVPTYVARIETGDGRNCAVITLNGQQVYRGPARSDWKTARRDAARFVVDAPEDKRVLEWAGAYIVGSCSYGGSPVPTVLEVLEEGAEVCFHIHWPEEAEGSRLRVSGKLLRSVLAAGDNIVVSSDTSRALALGMASEAPGKIGEDEVCVVMGKIGADGGWLETSSWVTVRKAALRETLRSIGVSACW